MPWQSSSARSFLFGRRADIEPGGSTSLRPVIALVALLLIATDVLQLVASRDTGIAEAHSDCLNLARSLAGHAHGAFQAADTVLVGLSERARVDGFSASSLERLNSLLALREKALPLLHRLLVLDRDGRVIASGLPQRAFPSAAAGEGSRAYFLHHSRDPAAAAFIGPPVRDAQDGSWVLTISRRLERQDGSFVGVAVAEIDASFFQSLYDSFDVGHGGVILLASRDGTLLVRHPLVPASTGRNLSRGELFSRVVPAGPGEPFAYVSLFDGRIRFASVAHVEGTELLVVVAREQYEVLSGWRQDARLHAAGLAIVLAGLFLLGARLSWQIEAREADRRMLHLRQGQLLAAEAASEESLRRLELAEQIAHVGNWRLSVPEGAISWSDETYRLHGKRKSDFTPTAENAAGLWHPADSPLLRRAIEQTIRDGNPFEVCLRAVRQDGELRHVLTRGTPQVGPDGQIVGIFGVSIDVTEQKEIESKLLRAQAEAAAANEALEAIAMQDGLTGLGNRRQFDRALNHEFRRAVRTGTSLALVLVDVDRFKEFNDRYGHPSGDACLCAIAGVISALANRPGDLVARYGGEEIAILLPGSDAAGCRVVAEAVAQAVRDLRVAHSGAEAGIVTISAGFEAFEPSHKHDVAGELIQRADIALYAAKRDGRNRVRWYGEIQPFETDALAG